MEHLIIYLLPGYSIGDRDLSANIRKSWFFHIGFQAVCMLIAVTLMEIGVLSSFAMGLIYLTFIVIQGFKRINELWETIVWIHTNFVYYDIFLFRYETDNINEGHLIVLKPKGD